MAALREDMIMEIVARLPLKNAIQCLVLNKSLFRLISQRKHALASSSYPDIKSSIFYQYRRRYRPNIIQRLGSCEKSITLPRNEGHIPYSDGPKILDSCNGILLLIYNDGDFPSVFNPITGGIMFLQGCPFSFRGAIKLAVDLREPRFHFKLVTVDSSTNPLWKITIFARLSGRPSWLVTSLEYEGGCKCCSSKSAYAHAHGCMYWRLCKKPDIIMVLDVAKEEIRTISWPFSAAPLLFGLSDGSLQSVCKLQDQIVIRGYDEVKDEWVLKYTISNIIVPRSRVGFFDGQRLLIIQEDDYGTKGIIHDVLKISDGYVFKMYNSPPKRIFSFVPSLAKVSDEYMDNLMAKSESPGHFSSFAGLQHIVTQESNAWNKLQEIKAVEMKKLLEAFYGREA